MAGDEQFGQAIHALLKELGWTHGELTPSLVHQALAQVRHLKKASSSSRYEFGPPSRPAEIDELRAELDRTKAELAQARLELADIAEHPYG